MLVVHLNLRRHLLTNQQQVCQLRGAMSASNAAASTDASVITKGSNSGASNANLRDASYDLILNSTGLK